MNLLSPYLPHLAVIGAAGKMGRGIAWLLLKLILYSPKSHKITLLLIDIQDSAFNDLKIYLLNQLKKDFNKNITAYEKAFNLSNNIDGLEKKVIQQTKNILNFSTDYDKLNNKKIIFEAIPEIPQIKINVLSDISKIIPQEAIIYSNTSSIPIHFLENHTQLKGRIIGFHFYNPPPVQPLVELIISKNNTPQSLQVAEYFLKCLGKTKVTSNDIAGFIGNGHFIREGLFALNKVEASMHKKSHNKKHTSSSETFLRINQVYEQYLLRPMGIFQLIDYVGLDIFKSITDVMSDNIKGESFHSNLLDDLIKNTNPGGQTPDGNQKDGIFKYRKRDIIAVYDMTKKTYINLNQLPVLKKSNHQLTWKTFKTSNAPQAHLQNHFKSIKMSHHSNLISECLNKSNSIANTLLKNNVASHQGDIDTVLKMGFHHLYGPFEIDHI